MKATEFVKKFGLDIVKDLIDRWADQTHVTNDSRMMIDVEKYIKQCPWFADDIDKMVSLAELKQIVDACELVKSYGGLQRSKDHLNHRRKYGLYQLPNLIYAINLVEQCQ